jgi:hypothetical protein
MSNSIAILTEKEYLKMMVRFVPKTLCKDNKEAESAILRLCMECFEHGRILEREGKLEVQL